MLNQENKKKVSQRDVMLAISQFVKDAYFEFEVQELPLEMQEISERLMETEHADELHIRLKTLNCLKFIRDFSKALQPFSRDQIIIATNKFINV